MSNRAFWAAIAEHLVIHLFGERKVPHSEAPYNPLDDIVDYCGCDSCKLLRRVTAIEARLSKDRVE